MKKIISLLALVLCLTLLVSCAKEKESSSSSEVFSPLFRFTVSEGKSSDTRLFYLAESDGFLYLHPGEEGGFTGGFVSPTRSISSEGIVKSEGDLKGVLVWEKEKDGAYVLTDKELFVTLLKENGAHKTDLSEGFSTENALALDSLSFVTEKDGLLLVHPVDLKETYVLAETARLPDFEALITTSDGGKRIWYAKKGTDTPYGGIGFFEYGANLPLGSEAFPFDTFLPIGESGVLFTRNLEDGGALYTYRNLDSGKVSSYTAPAAFDGVICDEGGTTLCGSKSEGDGGTITVVDLEKGNAKGTHTIEYGNPAPSLAIDKKAETLLFAIGKGSDEILGKLDLTKF